LIFTAKLTGNGDITITNGQILRNDGAGSEIPFTVSDDQFSILQNDQAKAVTIAPLKNTESPESFVPEVGQDPNILNGKYFVAFATQDKGSGIDHYEVKESKYQIFDFAKWNVVESPYVLTDQNLQSYIYIKAVDTAGNVRIEKISPLDSLPLYENLDDWFILIVNVVFLLFYKKLVWKKHK
jgi:hypothetical protein